MAEKRLSSDQVPVPAPGGGTDRSRVVLNAVKTDGPVGLGALALVPGTLISVTLPVSGIVSIFASARINSIGAFNHPSQAVMNVRIDGIDTNLDNQTSDIGVIGPSYAYNVSGVFSKFLTAGPHTFQLSMQGNSTLVASALEPAVLIVDYPDEIAGGGGGGGGGVGAAALVSRETTTVDPPGTVVSTGSSAFIPVPGTSMVITLAETKTVFFQGQASMPPDASNTGIAQLGLRVDGIDYPGTMGGLAVGYYPYAGLSVNKALELPPGPHTVLLVWRNVSPYGSYLFTGSDVPARLTAIYTEPVFGVGSLTKQEASNVTGVPTSDATGVFVLVPGTAISLTLLTDQVVMFDAFASGVAYVPGSYGFDVQLGIRIDGVDYPGTAAWWDSIYTMVYAPLRAFKAIDLPAGPHTAQVIMRRAINPGTGFIGIIDNTADRPTVLTAVYSDPQDIIDAGVGSLTSLEAENATGTPTTVTTAVYALVPATAISFVLATSQVVMFEAFGTVLPAPNGFCGQIGIRIDGIDYNGTGVDWDTIYPIISDTVVAHKAILLGPGPHTAQIVLREPAARGRDAKLTNSVALPTRLTAVYTDPEAINPGPFSTLLTAERTSGTIVISDTASLWADVPGPVAAPTFDLVFTPTATGKAEVSISGCAEGDARIIGIGLKVNGVDLIPAGLDPGGTVGTTVAHGFVAIGGGRGGVTQSFHISSISFSTLIDVVSGVPTTVRMRYICKDLAEGAPVDSRIFATTGHPLRMSVKYK